jgi:hypothetical protein
MAVARDSSVEVMEVVRGLVVRAVGGVGAMVAMTRVEVLIDVPAEVAVTVEPWTGSDKDATRKPLWTVVAVGSAVVGGEVIVPVRTDRSRPNIDAQRYLGGAGGCGTKHQGSRSKKRKYEVPFTHTQSPRLNWKRDGRRTVVRNNDVPVSGFGGGSGERLPAGGYRGGQGTKVSPKGRLRISGSCVDSESRTTKIRIWQPPIRDTE